MTDIDFTKIITNYRNEKSLNGYKVDVLKSGLQKYIRRANVNLALYCAVELDLFLEAKGGDRIHTNLVNRLRIIAMEDIGIACPNLISFIKDDIELLCKNRKTKKQEITRIEQKNALVRIVTIMASSNIRRIRLYSDIRSVFSNNVDDDNINLIPSFSVSFTKEESQDKVLICLSNNLLYYLENENEKAFHYLFAIKSKYEKVPSKHYRTNDVNCFLFFILEEFIKKRLNQEFFINNFKIMLSWYKDISSEESKLCVGHVLLLLLYRNKINIEEKITKFDIDSNNIYDINLNGKKIEFDDYVIDKHTFEGKVKGKTSADFALLGAYVENEDKNLLNIDYRNKYLVTRGAKSDETKTETFLFTYKMRAQLTTSNAKTDTYFATEISTGKNVVVKGPFLNLMDVNPALKMNQIKNFLTSVPLISMRIIEMIPNLFPCVPLGMRTRIENGRMYPFLIFEDLCNFSGDIPNKLKESKVWKDSYVVDWNKVTCIKFGNPEEMNDTQKRNFMIARTFRYIFEIKDNAERNFIVRGNDVYSIDEEGYLKGVRSFSQKGKPNKKDKIMIDFTIENYDELKQLVEEWKKSLLENKQKIIKEMNILTEEEFQKIIHNLEVSLIREQFLKEISNIIIY